MTVKTTYRPGEPIWTDLATPDLDASIDFYSALLGWSVQRGDDAFGGHSTFMLDGQKVAGVGPPMQEGQVPAWLTYLCTHDAAATAAAAAHAGGTILVGPMAVGDLGVMTVLLDPVGAAVGTWQPGTHAGAELVDVEGAVAWTELSTRDPAGALSFYGSVFGWAASVSDGYTELTLDGAAVAGCMAMPDTVPTAVPSFWMPYFAAADPEAKAEQVPALGGDLVVPSMEFPGGRFAVVRDLHGATFGLLDLRS